MILENFQRREESLRVAFKIWVRRMIARLGKHLVTSAVIKSNPE